MHVHKQPFCELVIANGATDDGHDTKEKDDLRRKRRSFHDQVMEKVRSIRTTLQAVEQTNERQCQAART